MKTPTYYPYGQKLPYYSVAEICYLVENDTANLKPHDERLRMKQVLKNNIQAQRGFAQSAPYERRAAHLAMAKKLEAYKNKIKISG